MADNKINLNEQYYAYFKAANIYGIVILQTNTQVVVRWETGSKTAHKLADGNLQIIEAGTNITQPDFFNSLAPAIKYLQTQAI